MRKRCLTVDNVLLHLLFHIPRQSETTPTIAHTLGLHTDVDLGASKTKKQGQWRIHFGGGGNSGGSGGSHIQIPEQRWMHPLSNAAGVETQAVASSFHWKQNCHIEV